MNFLKDRHEWINIEKNIATVGITRKALDEIGEVVNIALPKKGEEIKLNEAVCVIESNKSAIDIYSPISGKIIEVNNELYQNISLLNNFPEKQGWLFKVEVLDLKELEEL